MTPEKPFSKLYAILILHFLQDLPPLLDRFKELGLAPDRTWLVRKPYQYQKVNETTEYLRREGYHVEKCTAAEGADQPAGRVLKEMQRHLGPDSKFFVVEDGGFITPLLHTSEFSDMRERCIGAVEQTTKGIRNVEAVEKDPGLRIPVVSVAGSWLKRHLEAPEVGDALAFVVENFVRTFLKEGRLLGVNVLVIGYGAVGRQLAMSLHNREANVTVFDSDPQKQAEAVQRPYRFKVIPDTSNLTGYRLIVGTTGTTSLTADTLLHASDNTIFASGSSDRLEFDFDGIRDHLALPMDKNVLIRDYVTWYTLQDGRHLGMLCDGYPINFVLGQGVAKSVIDPILAELLAGAVLLADGSISGAGIHNVPEEIEKKFWDVYEFTSDPAKKTTRS